MKKLDKLTKKQKIITFISLLAILLSLVYIATIDTIKVVEYKNKAGDVLCTETYVNGELNTSPCPQRNKQWYPTLQPDLKNIT